MAGQEWLEEARKYGNLSERDRSEYWQQLTPAQQHALTTALSTMSQNTPSAPTRRGCSSPMAAGCVGVILGVVLTISAEVALLLMGVTAVSDTLQSFSGSNGGSSVPAAPPTSNLDNLSTQELLAYCGTKWEKEYPRIASICWEQREVDRINEKVYRERTEGQ